MRAGCRRADRNSDQLVKEGAGGGPVQQGREHKKWQKTSTRRTWELGADIYFICEADREWEACQKVERPYIEDVSVKVVEKTGTTPRIEELAYPVKPLGGSSLWERGLCDMPAGVRETGSMYKENLSL